MGIMIDYQETIIVTHCYLITIKWLLFSYIKIDFYFSIFVGKNVNTVPLLNLRRMGQGFLMMSVC